MSHRSRLVKALGAHTLLIGLCGLILIPFWWMFISSLRTPAQMYHFPPSLILRHPHLSVYGEAIAQIPFFEYVRNSAMIAGFNVLGATLSAVIVAYGFAKLSWAGNKPLFAILIGSMFLPGAATMVPTFLEFHTLGWIGTYLPLIVPSFFGSAFNIFLLRQFFRGIPDSLSESARLDGASEWTIIWRIVIPLSIPAIATVAIFTFMGSWDDFLSALIYLTHASQYTLPVGLYDFVGKQSSIWNQLMAACVMFMIPMVVVFFVGQRAFDRGGIRTTGIKG
jgi:multiple sugar transport system permease protein